MRVLVVLLSVLLLASPLSAERTSALLITHGSRDEPRVALTFDLCQVPAKPAGFDRGVIKVLRESGTPATFFAGGDWLRTHPLEGAELGSVATIEIGNHSWSHPDLRSLDDAAIRAEVEQGEQLLLGQFGKSPRLFRLPFGYYDGRVLQAVAATGVRIIQWDVVSGDPDRQLTREQLVANATRKVRNGSIIIMHGNGRGRQTAAALPEIVETLRARGFELVTVSDLLRVAND